MAKGSRRGGAVSSKKQGKLPFATQGTEGKDDVALKNKSRSYDSSDDEGNDKVAHDKEDDDLSDKSGNGIYLGEWGTSAEKQVTPSLFRPGPTLLRCSGSDIQLTKTAASSTRRSGASDAGKGRGRYMLVFPGWLSLRPAKSPQPADEPSQEEVNKESDVTQTSDHSHAKTRPSSQVLGRIINLGSDRPELHISFPSPNKRRSRRLVLTGKRSLCATRFMVLTFKATKVRSLKKKKSTASSSIVGSGGTVTCKDIFSSVIAFDGSSMRWEGQEEKESHPPTAENEPDAIPLTLHHYGGSDRSIDGGSSFVTGWKSGRSSIDLVPSSKTTRAPEADIALDEDKDDQVEGYGAGGLEAQDDTENDKDEMHHSDDEERRAGVDGKQPAPDEDANQTDRCYEDGANATSAATERSNDKPTKSTLSRTTRKAPVSHNGVESDEVASRNGDGAEDEASEDFKTGGNLRRNSKRTKTRQSPRSNNNGERVTEWAGEERVEVTSDEVATERSNDKSTESTLSGRTRKTRTSQKNVDYVEVESSDADGAEDEADSDDAPDFDSKRTSKETPRRSTRTYEKGKGFMENSTRKRMQSNNVESRGKTDGDEHGDRIRSGPTGNVAWEEQKDRITRKTDPIDGSTRKSKRRIDVASGDWDDGEDSEYEGEGDGVDGTGAFMRRSRQNSSKGERSEPTNRPTRKTNAIAVESSDGTDGEDEYDEDSTSRPTSNVAKQNRRRGVSIASVPKQNAQKEQEGERISRHSVLATSPRTRKSRRSIGEGSGDVDEDGRSDEVVEEDHDHDTTLKSKPKARDQQGKSMTRRNVPTSSPTRKSRRSIDEGSGDGDGGEDEVEEVDDDEDSPSRPTRDVTKRNAPKEQKGEVTTRNSIPRSPRIRKSKRSIDEGCGDEDEEDGKGSVGKDEEDSSSRPSGSLTKPSARKDKKGEVTTRNSVETCSRTRKSKRSSGGENDGEDAVNEGDGTSSNVTKQNARKNEEGERTTRNSVPTRSRTRQNERTIDQERSDEDDGEDAVDEDEYDSNSRPTRNVTQQSVGKDQKGMTRDRVATSSRTRKNKRSTDEGRGDDGVDEFDEDGEDEFGEDDEATSRTETKVRMSWGRQKGEGESRNPSVFRRRQREESSDMRSDDGSDRDDKINEDDDDSFRPPGDGTPESRPARKSDPPMSRTRRRKRIVYVESSGSEVEDVDKGEDDDDNKVGTPKRSRNERETEEGATQVTNRTMSGTRKRKTSVESNDEGDIQKDGDSADDFVTYTRAQRNTSRRSPRSPKKGHGTAQKSDLDVIRARNSRRKIGEDDGDGKEEKVGKEVEEATPKNMGKIAGSLVEMLETATDSEPSQFESVVAASNDDDHNDVPNVMDEDERVLKGADSAESTSEPKRRRVSKTSMNKKASVSVGTSPAARRRSSRKKVDQSALSSLVTETASASPQRRSRRRKAAVEVVTIESPSPNGTDKSSTMSSSAVGSKRRLSLDEDLGSDDEEFNFLAL